MDPIKKVKTEGNIYYRSTILFFKEDPYFKENQEDAITFYEDGIIVLSEQTGKIIESGEYQTIKEKYQLKDEQINQEYVGKLIVPGFIDCHTHFPQTEMICQYSSSLVHWLNTYTFPTEGQFKDLEYARKIAKVYLGEMIKNGTTSAMVMASVHKESVIALFDHALELNMRILCGKTLMDRHAPEYLTDTPESAKSESTELIEKYHNKERLLYSITPRFAPTSTPEQMQVVSDLKSKYPDCWMHTHLNENLQEIDWVKSLFPESKSYMRLYQDYNMVHKKTLFAHCVHCSQDDFDMFKESDCGAAFCPTSNGFLGAGIFDYHKSVKQGMNFGMGTDIGGGTDFSLIKTLQDAYKFIMLSQQNTEDRRPLTSLEGFYRATLGGAKALAIDDKVGKLESGFEADFVVLDWAVTPIQKLRQESIYKADNSMYVKGGEGNTFRLQEKLFGLMMMGDQLNVYATHIAGVRQYLNTRNN